jgi:hypothetical protein
MKRKWMTGLLIAGMIGTMMACGTEQGASGEANSQNQNEEETTEENAKDQSEEETVSDMVAVSDPIEASVDENGNYVVNGSFEDVDWTGWTIRNIDNVTEELDIYTRETDCYDGVQSLHFYSGSSTVNFTAEQTLTGLEEGTYKLTGYVQGDTAGDTDSSVYFYAVIDGETYTMDTSLNGYVAWNETVLDGLSVSNGEITIGVSVTNAVGGWGTIDAITLVKE